jgi:hypothetical protein
MALSLDLAAISESRMLTLIDNQSTHAVTGHFENGATGNLYEEGEHILGTGFQGSVTISYVGGTGNDVVLHLAASPVADADFDEDGDVDGLDFITWQQGLGTPSAGRDDGDANGDGAVNGADLDVWAGQFGDAVGQTSLAAVPEPGSWGLLLVAGVLARLVL